MQKIDFSQAVSKVSLSQGWAEARARYDASATLAATDWYVTRFAETGKPIPEDIAKARAEARETLSR